MKQLALVGSGIVSSLLFGAAMVHADNGTWTMPYGGSCASSACINVVNETSGDVAIQGWSDQAATGLSGHSGTGNGVHGDSTSGAGLYGTTASGDAVYANGGVNGTGVYATTVNGTGVTSVTTSGVAVFADSQSTFAAVYAENLSGSANGDGVFGFTEASAGHGVFGLGFRGVEGDNHTSSGVGVYGLNDGGGYAIYANGKAGGTGNWVSGSDIRLKRDIKDASYGLAEVLRLRPVTYRLNEGDDRVHVGFIAQEVQKVVPEVVTSLGSGDMLGVEYSSLVPVLARSIQEQQKLIEKQQAQIAALERGRNPVLASIASGGALAMCLVPLGFVAGRRRRNEGA